MPTPSTPKEWIPRSPAPHVEDLVLRLRQAMPQERVLLGMTERRAWSNDAWPYRTLATAHGADGPLPAVVVRPETEAEIEAVLQVAQELGVPVVPLGAGSGVVGGAASWGGEIALDLKRMNGLEMDVEGLTVTVGSGLLGQTLEDALLAQGVTLGHYPSSIACSTVGGWVAARSAGQLSSRYGKIEDMLLGLRLVTPAQGVLDTDDCPGTAGIWLGSEGCLGVISQVRLRLLPAPPPMFLRGYRFPDLSAALDAARSLMVAGIAPSVLRIYDPLDTRLALGHEGEKKKGAGRSDSGGLLGDRDPLAFVAKLALGGPRLVGRARKLLSRKCLVVVGMECSQVAGLSLLENLWRDGEDLGEGPGQTWLRKRHSVSFKAPRFFASGLFVDTMELACSWQDMPRLYDEMMNILGREALPMAHFSHAYPEGVSVYLSFAGRSDSQEEAQACYRRLWTAALDRALELGATCTHHHGVGVLKRSHASAEAGPALAAWSAVKRWVDPKNVLNPGVLFEGWAGDPGGQK